MKGARFKLACGIGSICGRPQHDFRFPATPRFEDFAHVQMCLRRGSRSSSEQYFMFPIPSRDRCDFFTKRSKGQPVAYRRCCVISDCVRRILAMLHVWFYCTPLFSHGGALPKCLRCTCRTLAKMRLMNAISHWPCLRPARGPPCPIPCMHAYMPTAHLPHHEKDQRRRNLPRFQEYICLESRALRLRFTDFAMIPRAATHRPRGQPP